MTVQEIQKLLKTLRLAAIKNKEDLTATTQASVLTCVVADAQKIAKDRCEETFTQEDLEKSAKKILKTTQDNIKIYEKNENAKTHLEKAKIEEDLLLNILPKQIDDQSLKESIQNIISEKNITKEDGNKAIGLIMKELKSLYKNSFDPQKATNFIKNSF